MQMRASVARKTIKSIRQQAFEQTHLFDSHPESSLDFEKVRSAVKDGYDKPFLLIDSSIIREKTRRFTAAMPRCTCASIPRISAATARSQGSSARTPARRAKSS